MAFFKLKNINFYKDFSEKNIVPTFYDNVYDKINSQIIFSTSKKQNLIKEKGIIAVTLIPPYFDLKISGLHDTFGLFKVSTHYGFLANIANYKDFDEYFKFQLNSKRRKSLKNQLRKLEKNFDVFYKVYLNEIDKLDCDFLLDKLKVMIQKRFTERGDTHSSISNWSFYKKSVYAKLKEKKACLFVIYNGDKPIAISLNYLYQNIFFGAIDSFDINYSKFSLGNIMILKKLEWCFMKCYSVFDMGYGDLKYKREWCDSVYKFQTHILYKKIDLRDKLVAYFICK